VEIRIRLRDGHEYTLLRESTDVEVLYAELISGRRRDLLEDWVPVDPGDRLRAAAVRGQAIAEITLVDANG
jgi:hypothetical protein